MRLTEKLYQATIATIGFSCCWLMYFTLLAANLPTLLAFFRAVESEGGWLMVLQEKTGWKGLVIFVSAVLLGNLAWLVSKLFERRFVEAWTKK